MSGTWLRPPGRLGRWPGLAAALILVAGCATTPGPASTASGPASAGAAPSASSAASGPATASPIRIGAVFPLQGTAGLLAADELEGVRIAVDLANADGGVDGRPLALDVRDLETSQDAPAVMRSFADAGVSIVIGSYSSDLSIAASQAADAAGLVYWESGAVADRLTGRGLPLVFRVGASGSDLGSGSATFAASQLASPLGRTAKTLRVAIVSAQDDYATSVADAAARTLDDAGVPVVARATYLPQAPDFAPVMTELAAARPDVVILASHIPDGIAFRRAMLAADLHVGALIGSTMAECDPDFAGELGADAIGIFASDRPTDGFRPEALTPAARAVYDRFETAWQAASTAPGSSLGAGTAEGGYGSDGTTGRYGDESSGSSDGDASAASISGPAEAPGAEATEEALAGFTAGWALFQHVLPDVAGGHIDAAAVAAAARAVDLPVGSLPNGAGLRFSGDPAILGQNTRASAVIWQWQAVRHYEYVWPPTYATGPITSVPLPR